GVERFEPTRHLWTGKRPPYPGLEAFTEQDASVFFGREEQITELLERLHPTLPRQEQRFVSVVGPSGSGKSSLVHAGLLAHLARQRRRWVTVVLVPEDCPNMNLARSVTDAPLRLGVSAASAKLVEGPAGLADRLEKVRQVSGRSTSVLLVVDQAEELITLNGERERESFLTLLRDALRQDSRLWIVLTLRSEYLTNFLSAGYADLFQHPVLVGPLQRSRLFEVIERPAALAGMEFEPGVVNEMVDDAGGGDALPLLAYILQALYLRAGRGGQVR